VGRAWHGAVTALASIKPVDPELELLLRRMGFEPLSSEYKSKSLRDSCGVGRDTYIASIAVVNLPRVYLRLCSTSLTKSVLVHFVL
jgi:hypothetical protein